MYRRSALDLSLVALLMVSPVVAAENAADQAVIRALDTEMVAALNARDIDRYMNCLAEDAVWMPPNAPVVVGKAAIRDLVSQLFEVPEYTVAHHLLTIKVSRSGDMAYLVYAYEFAVEDATGNPVMEKGKDISVFEKVDGSWKLTIDMWNSDAPAVAEP